MKMTNLFVFIHEIILKGQWKDVLGKLKTCMYVCTHPQMIQLSLHQIY